MRARKLVALLMLSVIVAGCGVSGEAGGGTTTPPADGEDPTTPAADGEASPSSLEVTAVDDGSGSGYGFELPESVEAGATQITLVNEGQEPHHAQLFRLNDNATVEDLGAQLATGDPAALLEVGAFDGGTGSVDPGATSSAEAVADLTEGTYAFLCFIENTEGTPHVAGGMLAPFEVTAAEEAAAMPETDEEVTLLDYGFDVPETLAGDATVAVRNASDAEPHELNILRLAEGATVDDVLALFASEGEEPPTGPPPFSSVGGLNAILPGASGAVNLDLEPGEYVFVCFIPSVLPDNEGAPHAALGMVKQVTLE